ncbi:hypothetical protein MMC26_000100 [Xylographa opegraphella]|nr:hypothetical protein [Xylographa opegraphella]
MCIQHVDVIKCRREESEKKAKLLHVNFTKFAKCNAAAPHNALPCEGDTVTFEVDETIKAVQKTDIEQNKCPVCHKLPRANATPVTGHTIGDIWVHYLFQHQRKCYAIYRDVEEKIGRTMIDGMKVHTRPEGWFSFFVDVSPNKIYKVNPDFKIEYVLVEVGQKRHKYEFKEIANIKFLRFGKPGEELVDKAGKK